MVQEKAYALARAVDKELATVAASFLPGGVREIIRGMSALLVDMAREIEAGRSRQSETERG